MASSRKVAVVTGANRGLGFETCRQLARVGTIVWLATARDVPTGGFFRDRKPIPW